MMTATGFELLSELEDEFEEEAAELELLFPRARAGTRTAPRKAKLTDPLPSGCIDVSGRCISVGCAAPYKCVRRLGGGCECRPGKLCPKAPDPASGECLRELRRDGNYLVCCPKYYGSGDPCCRDYPIPSRLRKKTRDDAKPIAPVLGELEDEFEEEAMEVEPFFARGGALEFGGPARVRRSAPRGAYQADLDDELEEEAVELEPLVSRGGLEFEHRKKGGGQKALFNFYFQVKNTMSTRVASAVPANLGGGSFNFSIDEKIPSKKKPRNVKYGKMKTIPHMGGIGVDAPITANFEITIKLFPPPSDPWQVPKSLSAKITSADCKRNKLSSSLAKNYPGGIFTVLGNVELREMYIFVRSGTGTLNDELARRGININELAYVSPGTATDNGTVHSIATWENLHLTCPYE
jgi:hypothetical protein